MIEWLDNMGWAGRITILCIALPYILLPYWVVTKLEKIISLLERLNRK